MAEALNLAYDLVNTLSDHFTLPENEHTTPLKTLPDNWQIVLANIHFETQRKRAESFHSELLPSDILLRLRAAEDNFTRLCCEAFGNDAGSVSTIMSTETKNHAHQIVAVISHDSPLKKAFLAAEFTPRNKDAFDSIYDAPRMVFYKPLSNW